MLFTLHFTELSQIAKFPIKLCTQRIEKKQNYEQIQVCVIKWTGSWYLCLDY